MTALLEPDALARDSLRDAVGGTIDSLTSLDELSAMVQHDSELDTIIFGPSVDTDLALEFTERLRASMLAALKRNQTLDGYLKVLQRTLTSLIIRSAAVPSSRSRATITEKVDPRI